MCKIFTSRFCAAKPFLQHVVFVITGIMQFVIPDIPAEVKTQMQREQILSKEAKYRHGKKETQKDEDLMSLLKHQETEDQMEDGGVHTISGNVPFRSSWGRRFSRLNDSLDAHVNVSSRKIRSDESIAWDAS